MITRKGKEGMREWTEYGFRLNHKNHLMVIQRDLPQVWWYTYHLFGRKQDDGIETVEAPLSRKRAEKFAREYIKQLQSN